MTSEAGHERKRRISQVLAQQRWPFDSPPVTSIFSIYASAQHNPWRLLLGGTRLGSDPTWCATLGAIRSSPGVSGGL